MGRVTNEAYRSDSDGAKPAPAIPTTPIEHAGPLFMVQPCRLDLQWYARIATGELTSRHVSGFGLRPLVWRSRHRRPAAHQRRSHDLNLLRLLRRAYFLASCMSCLRYGMQVGRRSTPGRHIVMGWGLDGMAGSPNRRSWHPRRRPYMGVGHGVSPWCPTFRAGGYEAQNIIWLSRRLA